MNKFKLLLILLIFGISETASSQCTPFNAVNQPVSQPVLDPIISKKFARVEFNEGFAIVVTGKYQIHQGYVSRIQYSLNELIPNINGQYDKIILNDFKGNFSSRAQARFTVQQSSGATPDCHFQEYLYGSEKILEENICGNGTKRFGVHNEVSTPFINKVFIPQFNASQQNFIYDTKITIEFHNDKSKFGYPAISLTKQSLSNPCAAFPEVLGTFSCSFFVYKAQTACTVPEGNIIGDRDKQVAQGYTIDVRKWFDTKTSEIASLYYTKPDGTNNYLVNPNGANSTAQSFPFLFDKVGEYTFSIKLRKNGRICQLPTIRVKVSDCKKCLVDMTNGEANAQFICFNRELRNFGGDIRFLNLKYKCNAPLPDFWEVRTISGTNGVLEQLNSSN